MRRFPTGTKNRWQVVAKYHKNKNRTVQDIITCAKKILHREKVDSYKKSVKKDKKKSAPKVEEKKTEENEDFWSQDQQNALQQAMKTFPSSKFKDANERWGKIAEAVGGKTKKQCVVRFKEIRKAILAKKKAKQAQQVKE